MLPRSQRYRGRKIGWGPCRATWFSICSIHHPKHRLIDCKMCMTGHYRNDIVRAIEHYFHEHHYYLWHWWVNRPNSSSRRRLEKWFPGLKGKE